MKFIVTKRNDDFHVCPQDHTEMWECGHTPESAIQRIQISRPELFVADFEIMYPTKASDNDQFVRRRDC